MSNNLSNPFKIEIHVTKYNHFCHQESVVKTSLKRLARSMVSVSENVTTQRPVPVVNDSDPWYKAVVKMHKHK